MILNEAIKKLIWEAVNQIESGRCKRVDVVPGVKVYACKNIIRIDIKTDE